MQPSNSEALNPSLESQTFPSVPQRSSLVAATFRPSRLHAAVAALEQEVALDCLGASDFWVQGFAILGLRLLRFVVFDAPGFNIRTSSVLSDE